MPEQYDTRKEGRLLRGLLPAGEGGGNEEIEEDTREMGSADDFNDTKPRWSLREAKTIASQRGKSTSTMVKDI